VCHKGQEWQIRARDGGKENMVDRLLGTIGPTAITGDTVPTHTGTLPSNYMAY
jgi:hypothetical protein